MVTALALSAYLGGVRLARLWATPPTPTAPPTTPTATLQAPSLTIGEVVEGKLGAEMPDTWRFDAQAEQTIILQIWVDPRDTSDQTAQFGLELTGPDRIKLLHQTGSASLPPYERIKLPVSGAYYIQIIPLSGSLGRYSLQLTMADETHPTLPPTNDIPTQTPHSENRTYTVTEGDTLSGIASNFNVTVESIVAANESLDAPDNIIHPGMVLSIPPALPTPTPIPDDCYIVQSGDNLWLLAQRFQYTVGDWILANERELEPPYLLDEGQVLHIPERSSRGEPVDCERASEWNERKEVITHVVQQEGVDLGCLAYKFGISISTIRWANREQLGDNPDLIKVGQSLTILPLDGILHTVTEGDTLESIARWYQVSVNDIVGWTPNQLTSESELKVGQKIVIPNGQWTPIALAEATDITPTLPSAGEVTPTVSATAPEATVTPQRAGSAPPGGVKYIDPFYALSKYDTGYCSNPPAGWGWSGQLSWPTNSHDIDPDRGFSEWHPAIDILSPLGSPIYAAETGVAIWAGYNTWGGGNLIILDHGGGRWTLYAHLDDVSVRCGEVVNRGTLIGTIGQTGASSFPHLHFEFRRNGYNYNPLNLLP